jgi:autotransporter-associated beta strand protein
MKTNLINLLNSPAPLRDAGDVPGRPKAILTRFMQCSLVAAISMLNAVSGQAQSSSGTWTSLAGGSWPDPANWNAGLYADGSDYSAIFTNLSLSADVTISLDGARTIGNLLFDDLNSTKHNWSVATGAGDPLTLAVSSGSPTLFVGANVSANLVLTVGTPNGLAKTGNGILVMSGTVNSSAGNLLLSGGTLKLDGALNSSSFTSGTGGGATPNISIGHLSNDVAVLQVNSGTYSFSGNDIMAIGNYGTGTYLQTGGNVTYGNSWGIGIGNQNSNAIGAMVISGGTFTDSNTGGEPIWVGMRGAATLTVSGTGTLTANKGLTLTRGVGGSAGNATLNLNGGSLLTTTITKGTGPGKAIVNFNGGTLSPLAATATFMAGLTAGYVQIGGAVIDSAGYNLTLGQALLHDTNGLGTSPDGGLIKLGAGTLTLTNNNHSYTGPTTISGGTLQIGSGGANGVLAGGRVTNNAALSFSRTGSLVITNVIAGTGSLTNVGSGIVALTAASTYTGDTVVNAGKLYINGSLNSASAVKVNSGGTLGGIGSVGTATVASGGIIEGGTNGVGVFALAGLTFTGNGTITLTPGTPSTGPAPLNTGVLTANGAAGSVVITINGTPAVGTYHLVAHSGAIVGTGFSAITAAAAPLGYTYVLVNNTGSIDLQVSAVGYNWTGGKSSEWSTNVIASPKNWKQSGVAVDYSNSHDVLFDDSGSNGVVTVSVADVSPSNVSFANVHSNYVLQGTKSITGGAAFFKTGTGSVAITSTNSYGGPTVISGGTVAASTLANGGLPSALGAGTAVTVQGAKLSYTGGNATSDRSLSISNGGILEITSAATTLTVLGPVAGSGTLTLAGAGKLQVDNGGTSGSLALDTVISNAALVFDRSDIVAFTNVLSGSGALTQLGTGTLQLGAVNSYSGDTTVGGGILQLGLASAVPSGTGKGNAVVNGTLDLYGFSQTLNGLSGAGTVDTTTGAAVTLTVGANDAGGVFSGVIQNTAGPLSLTKTGTNTLTLSGANTYTGVTTVNGGTLLVAAGGVVGNSGSDEVRVNGGTLTVAGGSVTANNFATGDGTEIDFLGNTTNSVLNLSSGTLTINKPNQWWDVVIGNHGSAIWNQTGGTTLLNVGEINVGNWADAGICSINLSGGSFTQTLPSGASGPYFYLGTRTNATMTISGTANVNIPALYLNRGASGASYGGVTTLNLNGGTLTTTAISFATAAAVINFNGATLQAGASSADFLPLAGGATGSVIIQSNGATIDSQGNTVAVNLPLLHDSSLGSTHDGGVTKLGSGTLTLTGANTYNGITVVSNGTLELTQPALVASSSAVIASGAVLQLTFAATNQIAALVLNGISQPPGVYNSATSPSYLAGTGSLLVASAVASNPTNLQYTAINGTLSLSWPADHLGWILQQRTNSLATGIRTNWFDVAGSGSITSTNIPINHSLPTVFYRLRHP